MIVTIIFLLITLALLILTLNGVKEAILEREYLFIVVGLIMAIATIFMAIYFIMTGF